MKTADLIKSIDELIRLAGITSSPSIKQGEIRFDLGACKKILRQFSERLGVLIALPQSSVFFEEIDKKTYIEALAFVRKLLAKQIDHFPAETGGTHISIVVFFALRGESDVKDYDVRPILAGLLEAYTRIAGGVFRKGTAAFFNELEKKNRSRMTALYADMKTLLKQKRPNGVSIYEKYNTLAVYRVFLPGWRFFLMCLFRIVAPNYAPGVNDFADLVIRHYGSAIFGHDVAVSISDESIFKDSGRMRFFNAMAGDRGDTVRELLDRIYSLRWREGSANVIAALNGITAHLAETTARMNIAGRLLPDKEDAPMINVDRYIFHEAQPRELLRQFQVESYYSRKTDCLTLNEILRDIQSAINDMWSRLDGLTDDLFHGRLKKGHSLTRIVIDLKIAGHYSAFADRLMKNKNLVAIDRSHVNAYLAKVRNSTVRCGEKLRAIAELVIMEESKNRDMNEYLFKKGYKLWAAELYHRYFEVSNFPEGDVFVTDRDYEEMLKVLSWDAFTAGFLLNRHIFEKVFFGPETDEIVRLKGQFFPERQVPEYMVNIIARTNEAVFAALPKSDAD